LPNHQKLSKAEFTLTYHRQEGKIDAMAPYSTTISSKGQVVIPAELRDQLGLKKGTRATWTNDGGRLVLTPLTERLLDEIQGFLKTRPGEPSVFEACLAEREEQRRRERERK
jgi:AbrB family looped-hinge helix DNA binding protein